MCRWPGAADLAWCDGGETKDVTSGYTRYQIPNLRSTRSPELKKQLHARSAAQCVPENRQKADSLQAVHRCCSVKGVVFSAPAREAARNWPCAFVLGGGQRPRRPRKGARRAALDRGRAGRAQAPGGRALRAQGDLRSSFITFLLSDANSRTSARSRRPWRTPCTTRRRSRARRRIRQGPRRAHAGRGRAGGGPRSPRASRHYVRM